MALRRSALCFFLSENQAASLWVEMDFGGKERGFNININLILAALKESVRGSKAALSTWGSSRDGLHLENMSINHQLLQKIFIIKMEMLL